MIQSKPIRQMYMVRGGDVREVLDQNDRIDKPINMHMIVRWVERCQVNKVYYIDLAARNSNGAYIRSRLTSIASDYGRKVKTFFVDDDVLAFFFVDVEEVFI